MKRSRRQRFRRRVRSRWFRLGGMALLVALASRLHCRSHWPVPVGRHAQQQTRRDETRRRETQPRKSTSDIVAHLKVALAHHRPSFHASFVILP
ncbi:hypothetical protein IWX50DRAFT_442994 [Phyllosticta citricarpa]